MRQRIIKFRAWDNRHTTIQGKVVGHMFYSDDYGDGLPTFFEMVSRDKRKVMQYTNLKDKNGKEIYFSDFVKIKGESSTQGKVNKVLEIKNWCDVVADFGLDNSIEANLDLEVIGNIYENPELSK